MIWRIVDSGSDGGSCSDNGAARGECKVKREQGAATGSGCWGGEGRERGWGSICFILNKMASF